MAAARTRSAPKRASRRVTFLITRSHPLPIRPHRGRRGPTVPRQSLPRLIDQSKDTAVIVLAGTSEHTKQPEAVPEETGLERDHPLLRFFAEGGATLTNYLALDDVVVTAALERMQRASDRAIADLAIGLWQRRCTDVGSACLRS